MAKQKDNRKPILKDTQQKFMTQAMFWDTHNYANREKYPPYWTMREEDYYDKEGTLYRSMYKQYMSSVDEYEFVMTYIGSMRHWEILQRADWFMNGVLNQSGTYRMTLGLNDWREHMRLRDQSKSRQLLQQAAEEGNVAAMRTLYGDSESPKKTSRKKAKKESSAQVSSIGGEVADFLSKRSAKGG